MISPHLGWLQKPSKKIQLGTLYYAPNQPRRFSSSFVALEAVSMSGHMASFSTASEHVPRHTRHGQILHWKKLVAGIGDS